MRKILTIVFFFLLLTVISLESFWGSKQEEPTGGTVSLRVTKEFGREVLLSTEVELPPETSALQALKQEIEVETDYGGEFISSIKGLDSKTGNNHLQDWFFYANGITANVGAGEYYPREGDILWWDYHAWEEGQITPSVTGAFPQPFINGYRGDKSKTEIFFTKSGKEPAKKVQEFLLDEGAEHVNKEDYREANLVDPQGITLVIALWDEIKEDEYWDELQKHRERTGWFARLSTENFTSLDFRGNKIQQYHQSTGAILVTGSGLGDPHPIWLVTAMDNESLNNAVNLLTNNPCKLENTFGVLVKPDEVVKLPR